MSFISEFKEFAMKGNVMDMAVGVIIGGAFGKIVSSLVDNVIMPLLGLIIGGIDFSNLGIHLKNATETKPALDLKYGIFLQNTFDFLIIAFSIFVVIQLINKSKKEKVVEEVKEEVKPAQEILLEEIRDLLKNK